MLRALTRLLGGGSSSRVAREAIAHDSRLPAKVVLDPLLAAPLAALRDSRPDDAVALLEEITAEHPEFADAHLLLGTVLHQQKRFEDARDSYLLAACFRPDWWPAHFQQGMLATEQGRFDEAVSALTRALELGAADARVHKALGGAYLQIKAPHAAVEQFRAALALQPELASVHNDLGCALFRELEEYEEGAQHIEHALALAPEDPAVLASWTMVLHHRNRSAEALRIADALLAKDPQLVEPRVNRALIRLSEGDFAGGWDDYEARKRLPQNTCVSDAPWPEWDGSSLAGRTLFVHGEQGLGDEIMFASCVPQVAAAAAECILECNPKLVDIFTRSFPEVRVLGKNAWRSDGRIREAPPHFKTASGSLPRFLRRSRGDFPEHAGYLRADPVKVDRWTAQLAKLPGRRKVGISWRGGIASTRRNLRSTRLRQWLPILSVPGIDFVSVQYTDPDEELGALRSAGCNVHCWPEALEDYDETAALVCALDLVVSVQTAVVHLAGALDCPVWALIPAVPEWRYAARGDGMPWYPAVRLIRQAQLGEWEPVITEVAGRLMKWAARPAG